MHSVYHIARADLLQRVRSYSFLITLGACLVAVYSIVPPAGADYSSVVFEQYRGLNSAAYIGGTTAMVCSLYLFLIGFYLVNTAVKRDIDTGVGQIIATTQVSKFSYLSGKMLSNFAVLFSINLVTALVMIAVFLVKREAGGMELGRLLFPLFTGTTPLMILISGIAVFIESIHWLKRGLVNIVFFFAWGFLLVASMRSLAERNVDSVPVQLVDVFGIRTLVDSVESELLQQDPGYKKGSVTISFPVFTKAERTFLYTGKQTLNQAWPARLLWFPCAFLLVALAAVAFKRFDPAYFSERSVRRSALMDKLWQRPLDDIPLPAGRGAADLPAPTFGFSLLGLIRSELKLLLLGRSTYGLLVTAGLLIATVAAPLSVSHRILLPCLWFCQALIISNAGCREVNHQTNEYIFSAPRPISRQLPAVYIALVILHLSLALPVAIRSLVLGNFYGIYGIVSGALFIPALAMFLAVWTRGGKLFEVLYTIGWYLLLNSIPIFDYVGGSEPARAAGMPHVFLLMAGVFLLLAVPGKRTHLTR